MRPGADGDPVVLSTAEFDVVCEAERLTDHRHVVLEVPSPGATYTERAELEAKAWAQLRARGLAEPGRDRTSPELGDLLVLLDRPQLSIDLRVWAPGRSIRAQAAAAGEAALLSIVDGDVVELAPVRAGSRPEAAVSVAGTGPAGEGRPVSLPHEVLMAASAATDATDPRSFAAELRDRGVSNDDAAALARMSEGMGMRGQFGVERRRSRGAKPVRGPRVVGFHDNASGRYLHVVRPSGDGRRWSTVVPADNQRIASYVRELVDETGDQLS